MKLKFTAMLLLAAVICGLFSATPVSGAENKIDMIWRDTHGVYVEKTEQVGETISDGKGGYHKEIETLMKVFPDQEYEVSRFSYADGYNTKITKMTVESSDESIATGEMRSVKNIYGADWDADQIHVAIKFKTKKTGTVVLTVFIECFYGEVKSTRRDTITVEVIDFDPEPYIRNEKNVDITDDESTSHYEIGKPVTWTVGVENITGDTGLESVSAMIQSLDYRIFTIDDYKWEETYITFTVTPVAAGTANLYIMLYSTKYNHVWGLQSYKEIEVHENGSSSSGGDEDDEKEPESIEIICPDDLKTADYYMEAGESTALRAEILPKDADQEVIWEITGLNGGGEKTAEIDSNGVVTALAPGKAKITAYTYDKKLSDEIEIKIDGINKVVLLNEEEAAISFKGVTLRHGHMAVMLVYESGKGIYYSFAPVDNSADTAKKVWKLLFDGTEGKVTKLFLDKPAVDSVMNKTWRGDGKYYSRVNEYSVSFENGKKAYERAEDDYNASPQPEWHLFGKFYAGYQCDDFAGAVLQAAKIAYSAALFPNQSFEIKTLIDKLMAELLKTQTAFDNFSFFRIMCPVDVRILNADGILLAAVKNGDTETVNLDGLWAFAEDDVKCIMIEKEKLADYRLELAATDDGEMDVGAMIFNNKNLVDLSAFHEIALVKGESFALDITGGNPRLFKTENGERAAEITSLVFIENGIDDSKPNLLPFYIGGGIMLLCLIAVFSIYIYKKIKKENKLINSN